MRQRALLSLSSLLALLSVVLFGVATAAAQNVRVRIGVLGHSAPLAVDSLASAFDVAASRGATFAAVAAVLAELKVPIDTRDSARGMVGVMRIAKLRTFAGAPISRFLSCGNGIIGANADNWRIYITALAFVDAKDSANTVLRVAMVGGAEDIQGSSKDPVACGSTGGFENFVFDRVKKRLAWPKP